MVAGASGAHAIAFEPQTHLRSKSIMFFSHSFLVLIHGKKGSTLNYLVLVYLFGTDRTLILFHF
jgi:hypothetical protein